MDKMHFLRLSLLCRIPFAAGPGIYVTGKRQQCNRACLFCQIHVISSLSVGAMFRKCNMILFSAASQMSPGQSL